MKKRIALIIAICIILNAVAVVMYLNSDDNVELKESDTGTSMYQFSP